MRINTFALKIKYLLYFYKYMSLQKNYAECIFDVYNGIKLK